MTDPLSELATITGMAKQTLMFFSKMNGIGYADIKAWYMQNSRLPNVAECSQIKAQSNGQVSRSN
jgi:hypothetical protein